MMMDCKLRYCRMKLEMNLQRLQVKHFQRDYVFQKQIVSSVFFCFDLDGTPARYVNRSFCVVF